MPMLVVGIRIMAVAVLHLIVRMSVRVARPGKHWAGMFMLMVCVMLMLVFMFQNLVSMFMLMMLGQMQPNTQGHEKSRTDELECHVLA